MILTLNELSEKLGVVRNTLTAWMQKGKIKYVQKTGTGHATRFLFDYEDVKRQISKWDKKHPDNLKK